MLDVEDFKFVKVDDSNGNEDYWFKVCGGSKAFLTELYTEEPISEVAEIVYSKDEKKLGIKRMYKSGGFDVVLTANKDIMRFVESVVMKQFE